MGIFVRLISSSYHSRNSKFRPSIFRTFFRSKLIIVRFIIKFFILVTTKYTISNVVMYSGSVRTIDWNFVIVST